MNSDTGRYLTLSSPTVMIRPIRFTRIGFFKRNRDE